MPGWFWCLGYGLCGAVTAVWYLRRVTTSPRRMDHLESEMRNLPPYIPGPGAFVVVALIVGWPILVIQYTLTGSAFRGEPRDEDTR